MRRVRLLIVLVVSGAVPAWLSLPATAIALGPTVTLTAPADGALISGGQPTFEGTSSNAPLFDRPNVTVRVYRGTSASGSPIETLTGSSGSFSVKPNRSLADGQYTARAEHDALGFPPAFSSPVTFTIHNALPSITLESPGNAPLLTSTPALTGVAETAPNDSKSVGIVIYPGDSTNATPLAAEQGPVGAGGHYSIKVTPALPDGRYTAVATQNDSGGVTGFSGPQTFRIKVNAPAVTLAAPGPGSSGSDSQPEFSGAAGISLGDSSRITVVLYPGGSATGRQVGTMSLTANGSSWSGRWPQRLALGRYTARAIQSDDAGHTGLSNANSFLIVPVTNTIGSRVSLSRRGVVSVPISCLAPAGQVCTGDVLVLTVPTFRPVAGGPKGHIRLMFVYVSVPGGRTVTIMRTVGGPAMRTLRRAGAVRVSVIAVLSRSGAAEETISAIRRLRSGG